MSDYTPVGKFVVLSDMSGHTTQKSTYQLHSRHLPSKEEGEFFAEFIRDTELNGRHHKHKKIFVMQIVAVLEPES
jgi:hypothetical protein